MVVEGGNHLEGWIIFVSLFFVGVDGYIYIHISSGAEKKMHGFLLEKKH